MLENRSRSLGLLLDIDGVLHVGDDPLPGAISALAQLREITSGIRLVTNTTSKPRREILERLGAMGFRVQPEEVLTPARLALRHCRERGYRRVRLLVRHALREDLADLEEAQEGSRVEAVVLGDLGPGFTDAVLNSAFRMLLEGAELIALQHNRYWRSAKGLVLDVGAYAAALEYAAGIEAVVVGKPSRPFFDQALAELAVEPQAALMVGDDVEADVGGALEAGIPAVLVRTGKYHSAAVAGSGIEPTATIDSIADLPGLLRA